MLRGTKPSKVDKRLKALFYGDAGVGKTTAAIQFPKPYVIDTEKGCVNDKYVDILNEVGGAIFHTVSFSELITEVKTLISEKHDYKTLVIDPLTNIHHNLIDECQNSLRSGKDDGTGFGRHYALANKKMRHLFNLLSRLDMNVIVTAHSKDKYVEGTVNTTSGKTFDCYKKSEFLFDLLFKIRREGKDLVATVEKSRVDGFELYKDYVFSYKNISKIYGKEILERDCTPEVLASKDQISSLNDLIYKLNVQEKVTSKWLESAGCYDFSEMNEKTIQKCIDYLQNKVEESMIKDDVEM